MILITGGTGSVGHELIKQLSSRAVSVRALVRNTEKATAIALPGVQLVQGDFSDAASVSSALQGIDQVFLLAPPVPDLDTVECAFIDQAKRAGVKQIVNLSAVGAGIGVPHRFGHWHGKTEHYLIQSGIGYTILRPNFFMQNLLGMADMIRSGTIYVPAGTGKAPFIDVRDIAAVAAACLTENGHDNRIHEVTGAEVIGYADIAAAFGRVLGKPVTYVDIPTEAAAKSMIDNGMPKWLADALNELNMGLKENRFATVSDTVARVAKKTPISIEQFIQDYRDVFA